MTVDSGGNATFSGTVSGASIVSSSINIGNGNFTVNLSGAVESNNAKITAATFNATGIIYAERGIVCNGEIEADIGSLEKINTQSIYCTGMVYGGGWTQISDRREKR
ncbi:tail fiber domain-containing protein, partial [Enterocloster bolteae]|nr:tail fiber domain-containing protein [Enterocloster bolteae]